MEEKGINFVIKEIEKGKRQHRVTVPKWGDKVRFVKIDPLPDTLFKKKK